MTRAAQESLAPVHTIVCLDSSLHPVHFHATSPLHADKLVNFTRPCARACMGRCGLVDAWGPGGLRWIPCPRILLPAAPASFWPSLRAVPPAAVAGSAVAAAVVASLPRTRPWQQFSGPARYLGAVGPWWKGIQNGAHNAKSLNSLPAQTHARTYVRARTARSLLRARRCPIVLVAKVAVRACRLLSKGTPAQVNRRGSVLRGGLNGRTGGQAHLAA